MQERVRTLRKSLNLSQEAFAERIGMTKNYISLVETGNRNLSERTISDICRVFNVNRDWLVDGIGDPLLPPEDEEAAYVAELLGDDDNPLYDIIKAIMKTYSELGTKEQTVLKSFAKDLAEKMKEQ